jgi:hypothetical protein
MKSSRKLYISITTFLLTPLLTLAAPMSGAHAATSASPITLCLRLFPSGPTTKPPIVAEPIAPKRCAANFKYYEIPDRASELANLNALLAGSYNAGLSVGVYKTVQKMIPTPAPTKK